MSQYVILQQIKLGLIEQNINLVAVRIHNPEASKFTLIVSDPEQDALAVCSLSSLNKQIRN